MAQYDLPGMLSYILKVTGHPKLAYIGHSQVHCIVAHYSIALLIV